MKAQASGADPLDLREGMAREEHALVRDTIDRRKRATHLWLEDVGRVGPHPYGYSHSGNETNPYFHQIEPGRFADLGGVLGVARLEDGRGVAAADLDGDGDLDLALRNAFFAPLVIFRNEVGAPRPSTIVALSATDCNARGIGATVRAGSQVRRIVCGDSYLSCSPAEAHFGGEVTSLRVRWPCGRETEIDGLPGTGRVTVLEDGTWTHAPFAEPVRSTREAARTLRVGDPFPLPVRSAVVHVWSSKLAACGEDVASYESLAEKLDGFVSINIDAKDARFEEGLKALGLSVAVLDGAPVRDALVAPARPLLPVVYKIDAEGRVAAKHVGRCDVVAWANSP